MCERELETEQNCNILTPTLLAITAFLSCSPGLLNWGPGCPASLGHVSQSSIFSRTGLIPNCSIGGPEGPSAGCCFLYSIISPTLWSPNWLNFLCTELYNSSTPTFFLWASQIALIQSIHGQGYTLLFLDRMHLLFTQMHFLFWQLSHVIGQYTTKVHIWHVILWEFKNNKNAIETAKKICSVCARKVITDCQVQNWFSKFHSGDTSLRHDPRPGRSSHLDPDALRKVTECNPHKSTQEFALDLNTSQSTLCLYMKNYRKVSKLAVWVPQAQSKTNKEDCIYIGMTSFSKISLQVMKNGYFIAMINAKGNGLQGWISTVYSNFEFLGLVVSVCQWPRRPGFNPRSSYTKDPPQNGTWCLLA